MKDLVELGGQQRKQGGTVVSFWQVFFLKWFFDVLEDVFQNGLTVTITSGLSNNRTESPAGERLVPLMEQDQSILWLKL